MENEWSVRESADVGVVGGANKPESRTWGGGVGRVPGRAILET